MSARFAQAGQQVSLSKATYEFIELCNSI